MTMPIPDNRSEVSEVEVIIHRDILEVFTERFARNNQFAGQIGLRCRFCKHLPQGSTAHLSTIFPNALECIYRAVARFQKHHLSTCPYIPEEIKAKIRVLGDKKSYRGSKSYWVESALRLGFRTNPHQNGIIFCLEIPNSLYTEGDED